MSFDILDEDTILERVDAFSIYSFYIGAELELKTAYPSPLRDDDDVPSFNLYQYKGEIFFKDHALAESGTVFKFVKLMFGYKTLLDAYTRINLDFCLELIGGNTEIPCTGVKATLSSSFKEKESVQEIRIHSKPKYSKEFIQFWKKWGIKLSLMESYFITEVNNVQYIYNKRTIVVYPKDFTIAYRIYQKYKIYTPYGDKMKKFLNNFPITYIEGYLQLEYKNDFLIITKSTKEILFFRSHFNWDAIAGKSETTMIRRYMMLRLVQKYKYIFIWLDNDVAGQKSQRAYLEEYPFLIPIYYMVEKKDPTDEYFNRQDKSTVLQEIKTLIENGKDIRHRRETPIPRR
jgi:hypothetical protein